MRIRKYEDKDAAEIKRLFLLLDAYSLEILPDDLKKFEEIDDLEKVVNYFIRNKNRKNIRKRKTLVADDGKGKIAGLISGSVTKEIPGCTLSVYGNVEVFFVEEKHRGKGTGRKLYENLEDWFREKGCEVIKVDTWITNEHAIRIYEKIGFRSIGITFVKEMRG